MKKWFDNPVLVSELKMRTRSWRTVFMMLGYLGIMLVITYLIFATNMQNFINFEISRQIEIQLYMILALTQFSLIIVLIPAQTAGAISGERERQPLDLLLCTPLPPSSIVLGKMLSAMGFVLLLVISSIPLFSLVFLFGGVIAADIISLFAFYIITAFAVGSIGIFCSVMFKRTVTATVAAYISILALGIISVLLGVFMLVVFKNNNPNFSGTYIPFVFYLNPVVGLLDLLNSQLGDIGIGVLFSSSNSGQANGLGWLAQKIGMWGVNSLIMLAISAVLLAISTWMIKTIKRIKRGSKNALEKTNG